MIDSFGQTILPSEVPFISNRDLLDRILALEAKVYNLPDDVVVASRTPCKHCGFVHGILFPDCQQPI